EIQVLDPETNAYRISKGAVDEDIKHQLKYCRPSEKIAILRHHSHPQAQFLWSIHRDLFHYCAVQLEAIADNARDVDLAIRWGFGWEHGPFEIWQGAGWKQIATWINEDIAAGKSMRDTPLPAWVMEIAEQDIQAVHTPQGSYAPASKTLHHR